MALTEGSGHPWALKRLARPPARWTASSCCGTTPRIRCFSKSVAVAFYPIRASRTSAGDQRFIRVARAALGEGPFSDAHGRHNMRRNILTETRQNCRERQQHVFVSVLAAVQLALLRTTPPGWSVADKSLIVMWSDPRVCRSCAMTHRR